MNLQFQLSACHTMQFANGASYNEHQLNFFDWAFFSENYVSISDFHRISPQKGLKRTSILFDYTIKAYKKCTTIKSLYCILIKQIHYSNFHTRSADLSSPGVPSMAVPDFGWSDLNQEVQIMPNPSLLAPPDFQTFLRPCVNELHSNNVYAQWQVVVYAELSMFFFPFLSFI